MNAPQPPEIKHRLPDPGIETHAIGWIFFIVERNGSIEALLLASLCLLPLNFPKCQVLTKPTRRKKKSYRPSFRVMGLPFRGLQTD